MNSDDEKQIRENEALEMEESEPSEQPPICQSERESDSAPEMGPEGVQAEKKQKLDLAKKILEEKLEAYKEKIGLKKKQNGGNGS